MDKDVLRRIRRAIREKRYQITDHALEEADADNLTLGDIRTVLLSGELYSTYTDDPRGSRYVIRGSVAQSSLTLFVDFSVMVSC